jgi:DNA-binding MurR/RpiR family transcriptional regulator
MLNEIKNASADFSPKQLNVAQYVLNNYTKVAFMTSTTLASYANVSEATVIRFTTTLGYSGYHEFQSKLRKHVQTEISLLDRFSFNLDSDPGDVYANIFTSEVNIINRTFTEENIKAFDLAVKLLGDKKELFLIGTQASSTLVTYTFNVMNKIFPRVFPITELTEQNLKLLSSACKEAIAFIYSFARYSKATIRLYNELMNRNIQTISFTNSHLSPTAQNVDALIVVPNQSSYFTSSFAAVITTINALAVKTSYTYKGQTKENIAQFDKYSSDYDIFVK